MGLRGWGVMITDESFQIPSPLPNRLIPQCLHGSQIRRLLIFVIAFFSSESWQSCFCIDAEAGLPTFRGEKGYYEDQEASYLASMEALRNEPIRQWRWYLKRFVSYHDTPPAQSHRLLAAMEEKLAEQFLGLITQNVSGLHRKAGFAMEARNILGYQSEKLFCQLFFHCRQQPMGLRGWGVMITDESFQIPSPLPNRLIPQCLHGSQIRRLLIFVIAFFSSESWQSCFCIDAEAGLPTFRGEKGYYEDQEASYLASMEALRNEPIRQWRWYLKRFVSYHDTPPAQSHRLLAAMEEKLAEQFLGLITQNVSGLHRKAGSLKVLEIHGSIREMRNMKTRELRHLPETWVENPPSEDELQGWRPNVCFIGESYEDYPLEESIQACRNCEILLVIGTAGIIHTPVWLAQEARDSGALVINVNPHPGEVDQVAQHSFVGTALDYFNLDENRWWEEG